MVLSAGSWRVQLTDESILKKYVKCKEHQQPASWVSFWKTGGNMCGSCRSRTWRNSKRGAGCYFSAEAFTVRCTPPTFHSWQPVSLWLKTGNFLQVVLSLVIWGKTLAIIIILNTMSTNSWGSYQLSPTILCLHPWSTHSYHCSMSPPRHPLWSLSTTECCPRVKILFFYVHRHERLHATDSILFLLLRLTSPACSPCIISWSFSILTMPFIELFSADFINTSPLTKLPSR